MEWPFKEGSEDAKLAGTLHLREGSKRSLKGWLQGTFKPLLRGLARASSSSHLWKVEEGLKGGLKGLEGGFRRASRGLQALFKGA